MATSTATFTTIDEYLELQPEPLRKKLQKLRATIKKAAPAAQEVISYGMPGFVYNGKLAWFAAFKNHYALFVPPVFKEPFAAELKGFETTKSSIHFPLDQLFPADLVTAIIRYAMKWNDKKAARGKSTRKK